MKSLFAARWIAAALVLWLGLPANCAAAAAGREVAQPAQSSPLPEAPQAQTAQNSPPQPSPSAGQSSSQAGAPAPAVGTAAAPYESSSGVTAARPAGAVIAPSKQHRVRRIFIRVSILVGAAAAVGAVAALSRASPSQPH